MENALMGNVHLFLAQLQGFAEVAAAEQTPLPPSQDVQATLLAPPLTFRADDGGVSGAPLAASDPPPPFREHYVHTDPDPSCLAQLRTLPDGYAVQLSTAQPLEVRLGQVLSACVDEAASLADTVQRIDAVLGAMAPRLTSTAMAMPRPGATAVEALLAAVAELLLVGREPSAPAANFPAIETLSTHELLCALADVCQQLTSANGIATAAQAQFVEAAAAFFSQRPLTLATALFVHLAQAMLARHASAPFMANAVLRALFKLQSAAKSVAGGAATDFTATADFTADVTLAAGVDIKSASGWRLPLVVPPGTTNLTITLLSGAAVSITVAGKTLQAATRGGVGPASWAAEDAMPANVQVLDKAGMTAAPAVPADGTASSVLLLCGRLATSLRVTASTRSALEPLGSIVGRTAVDAIVSAAKLRLCGDLKGLGGDVYPLLASGLRPSSDTPTGLGCALLSHPDTPDPAAADLLKKLGAQTRQTSGWQADLTRHLLAALMPFCDEAAAVKAIGQRWLQDWVEPLQGAVNDPAKEVLRHLCRFVVERLQPPPLAQRNASPLALLKHLRRLLEARTTPKALEALLERQARTAQHTLPVLKLLQLLQPTTPLGIADVVAAWLRAGGVRHYMAPFDGAGLERSTECRKTVHELLEGALAANPSTTLKALAAHALDQPDLQWTLHGPVLPTALRLGDAAVADSTDGLLTYNTISTSKSGVRVSTAVAGTVVVERTGMDTLPLRGTGGWAVRAPAPSQYFEVRLESKSIKRAVVGVCCPLDVVDTVSEIRREARSRIACVDTGAAKRCTAGPGDVVGAGFCPASQTAFLTLNGLLLQRQALDLPPETELVFPFVTYDTTDKSTIHINFGQAPFLYDYRLETASDAATSDVHAARETLTALCRRAAAVADPSLLSTLQGSVVGMARLPSAAIRCFTSLPALSKPGAEALAATLLQHVAGCDSSHHQRCLLQGLEALVARSPKSFTAPLVQQVLSAVEPLRVALGAARPRARVPYVPQWMASTDSTSFIASAVVQIVPEKEFCHATGTPLPSAGKVSFSVVVNSRAGEIRPLATLGQFYIGVTTAKVAALSNIASWKSAEAAPCVWALHSVAHSQLHHCNDAGFGHDPFLFACAMPVTVEIDRDLGTMSVRRPGRVYPTVFDGIPKGAALTPFVQIIGEKTAAVLLPGTQERCLGNEDLLAAQIVSLYRALLTTAGGAAPIAAVVQQGLHVQAKDQAFALRVLGAVRDTRHAESRHGKACSSVVVQRIRTSGVAEVQTFDGALHSVDVSTLNAASAFVPYPPLVFADAEQPVELGDDEEDDCLPERTADGVATCLEAGVAFLREWNQRVLACAALAQAEAASRDALALAEQAAVSTALSAHRRLVVSALQDLNMALMSNVLQPPIMPRTCTFSRRDSSAALQFPAHYHGKLILTPTDGAMQTSEAFVAIANESIPAQGTATVRMRVEYDWLGLLPQLPHRPLPLVSGFYIGLCAESYRGRPRDHTRVTPADMWAVPSVDSRMYHLPHAASAATDIVNFFSRDTIRLTIDRSQGTMEVFATSPGRMERSLGVAFRNLPKDVALYPFVQLRHARGAALFLPDNSALPRFPDNKIQFATKLRTKSHTCDGCLNQLVETPVAAPNWYCCNQCQNFDLCTACFNSHYHCGHTFTHMRTTSFLPSPVSTFVPARNADCELSGAPLSVAASANCTFDPAAFNLRAAIASDDAEAMVAWAVMRRRGAAIEAEVAFDVQPGASSSRSALVGVAPVDQIVGKTRQEVLAAMAGAAAKSISIAAMGSDESDVKFPGAVEIVTRSATRGFALDDRLAFSLAGDVLDIQRRGSLCRRYTVKWAPDEKLCVFAFFAGSGVTCSALPQASTAIVGKVGEVHPSKRVRITNGAANRWTSIDQARPPLSLVKQFGDLREGMTVFITLPRETSEFVPCTVTKLGQSGEAVEVHDGDVTRSVAVDAIFVAAVPEAPSVSKAKDPDDMHMYPDVKRRLRRFYTQHAPAKSDEEMDKAIALYAKAPGGHPAMWTALVAKYGPEPVDPIALPKSRRRATAAVRATDIVGCIAMLRFLLTALECPATRDAALKASRAVSDVLQLLASMDSCALPLDRLERGALDAEAADCLVPVVDPPEVVKPSCTVSDGWWLAPPQASHWLPETAAFAGRMRSSTGFSFDVAGRLDTRQASVAFTAGRETISAAFAVASVAAVRETRLVTVRLVAEGGAANAEALAALLRCTAGESLKSALARPDTETTPATLTFTGSFSQAKQGVAGMWRLISGSSGEGFLQLPGPAGDFIAPLPDLAPIAAAEVPPAPAAPQLIRSLATEFARRIRLATAEATFTGGAPELLFRELSFCASLEQARAVQQLRLHSSLALTGLAAHSADVCLDAGASLQRCGNATRLLRSIVLAAGDDLPEALQWRVFHAVASAAHLHWNSKDVMECFAALVDRHKQHAATQQLVGPLFHHFSRLAQAGFAQGGLLSAVCDAFLPLAETVPFVQAEKALPLRCFAFLTDVAESVVRGHALPLCASAPIAADDASQWRPMTSATVVKATRIVYGRLSSWSPVPKDRIVYCEVEEEAESRVVVGICAAAFLTEDTYVGYSGSSFGFDGTTAMHAYAATRIGHVTIAAGDIIGCRVSLPDGTVQWSVNSHVFPAVAIPPAILAASEVYVVIQASRSTVGTAIASVKGRLRHLPHDAAPLHDVAADCSSRYVPAERAEGLTPMPAKFYHDLAAAEGTGAPTAAGSEPYQRQLANLARSLQSIVPFVDFERDASALLTTFAVVKAIVPPSALSAMIDVTLLTAVDRHSLQQVTVRWFDLSSPHSRTPEEALSYTVLAQLYRQIGADPSLLEQNPVFTTALMMTDSGHTPIDAGGPYSTVWTLLGEEMTSEDTSTFHRNPLFRFCSSATGKYLFPDAARSTPTDLSLLAFFGRVMGHLARAKRCMAVELSPVVWRFFTEEPLTVDDYVTYVDRQLADRLRDVDSLEPEELAAAFPQFHQAVEQLAPVYARLGEQVLHRKAAEHSILHAALPQLKALQRGLWDSLGRANTRLMTPQQLETLVCGNPNPTFEEVQASISCQLPEPYATTFWQALRTLSKEEWSGFFYFATAQRRYPLSKKISVTPTAQSSGHLPQASTCFAHVSTPLYPTLELWIEKLRSAVQCTVMELA